MDAPEFTEDSPREKQRPGKRAVEEDEDVPEIEKRSKVEKTEKRRPRSKEALKSKSKKAQRAAPPPSKASIDEDEDEEEIVPPATIELGASSHPTPDGSKAVSSLPSDPKKALPRREEDFSCVRITPPGWDAAIRSASRWIVG